MIHRVQHDLFLSPCWLSRSELPHKSTVIQNPHMRVGTNPTHRPKFPSPAGIEPAPHPIVQVQSIIPPTAGPWSRY